AVEHLVRVEIQVVTERSELHGVHAEVGEQPQVSRRLYMVQILALRHRQCQFVEYLAGQRRLGGRRDVGQQQLHLVPDKTYRDEEVLVNRDQPDDPALGRLLPQGGDQALEARGRTRRQQRDLPAPV